MKLQSLVAAVLLAAGSVHAADATLTVQANVLEFCQFTSPNFTLNFGNVSPASNGTGKTSVSVSCNSNASGFLQLEVGGTKFDGAGKTISGTMAHTQQPTSTLKYELTFAQLTTAAGTGGFFTHTFDVDGTIKASDIEGKLAGTYEDKLTLTVTP